MVFSGSDQDVQLRDEPSQRVSAQTGKADKMHISIRTMNECVDCRLHGWESTRSKPLQSENSALETYLRLCHEDAGNTYPSVFPASQYIISDTLTTSLPLPVESGLNTRPAIQTPSPQTT